jgi:hypothetical protein
MSHLNLSTAMTNLEVFRGLEVTFSYFISWNVFEYWKILGINNKDIRARPNYAVRSSSSAVAHGHRPNAFTMHAQTCLKPTALLGPKLPQSSRFCAALVRPCALTSQVLAPLGSTPLLCASPHRCSAPPCRRRQASPRAS